MTPRERELFEPGPFTLPVDFNSWRRAYSQALADADVNVQRATALAGHASLEAHQRYLASTGKLLRFPEAALPKLGVGFAPNHVQNSEASNANSGSGWQDLNLQQPAPKAGPLPG